MAVRKSVTQEACNTNVKKMMEEIKEVRTEVGEVKDSVSDLHVLVARLPEKILEKTDTKYASKAVEKIIYFIGGLVVTSIVGAFMALVLK
jgi:hypothetical protein